MRSVENIAKETAALKAQELEYKRAHQEFLKGRNIVQLENEAKARLKAAQDEQKRILEQTANAAHQLDLAKAEVAKKEAEVSKRLTEASEKLAESNDIKSKAQAERQEVLVLKAQAERELEELRKKQDHCDKLCQRVKDFALSL